MRIPIVVILIAVFSNASPLRAEARYHGRQVSTENYQRPTPGTQSRYADDPTRPSLDFGFTKFHLMDKEEGSQFLGTEDNYTRSLNGINRSLVVGTPQPVSQQEFLDYEAAQAVDMDEDLKTQVAGALSTVAKTIEHLGLDLRLPPNVHIIMTTGKDGFDSCYTRRNAIICPAKSLPKSGEPLVTLLAHELFHVISRYATPQKRTQVYALAGFKASPQLDIGKEVGEKLLVNPDAYTYKHYITTTHLKSGRKIDVVPIIPVPITQEQITPDFDLGKALKTSLLVLKPSDTPSTPASDIEGHPAVIPAERTSYADDVGKNTKYIIHPEEIMADNFSFLITGKWRQERALPLSYPDIKILNALNTVLREAN